MIVFLACLLAFILGFTAHRASICTIRAVAELMSARTAYMLASIGKSALWVIAITVPIFWLTGVGVKPSGWQLTLFALCGGLLFGIGAALNGACAYSTMARLVDGEIGMLLAILGFAAGVFGFTLLLDAGLLTRPEPAPPLIDSASIALAGLALLLFAGLVFELVRLWRTRSKGATISSLVRAPQYRLSTAALVIGGCGAAIFVMVGSPGYAATFQNVIESVIGTRAAPALQRSLLVLSVLAGMAVSTLERGSFFIDWRPRLSWLRNVAGGVLMGLGTAMLPGGNDALVLYGIPSLSPHAVPAYGALLIGAAMGLVAIRVLTRSDIRVSCRNDIYRIEEQPQSSILSAHLPRA